MINMDKNNSFEKGPEQESLEDFQREIKELKDKEIEEKGKGGNTHLVRIQTEELTEDDMRIWQTYKGLTVDSITEKNLKDFRKYRSRIDEEEEEGRFNFAAVMADRLYSLWGKKELKELQNKEK
jgi:hypothetical protein